MSSSIPVVLVVVLIGISESIKADSLMMTSSLTPEISKSDKLKQIVPQNAESSEDTDAFETDISNEHDPGDALKDSSSPDAHVLRNKTTENKAKNTMTGLNDSENLNLARPASSYQEALLNRLQDQLNQFVVGLPLDLGFSTLNYICSTIVDLGVVRSKLIPDMSRMSFLLRSSDDCQNTSIPLTQAERLWNTTGFYQDRPTVLFITGWTTSINNSNSGPVAKAYLCRNDTNVLILDAANFIDTLYTWSALNTEVIGDYLAKALLRLNTSYVTKQFHLVGHSLGAQIAGSAGRNYRRLSGGQILKRITGLDPANPCFYDGNELEGLRSGDARFVDIIHTNPGMFGTSKRAGDADFFVQGRIPFKPGCESLDPISCSHQRAVDYWTETVYPSNGNDFLAKRCKRYSELLLGNYCKNTNTVMGFAAKATGLGLFYVGANREEPYGQNANLESYTNSATKCGACA
ncbi:phospholipase A1 2 [Drosophila mauritiana]|uniref:Phospholipase A1 2 n=1 Tax=Drosophila mauritiana TaxID=7226 RepID=A0A6P8L3W5_DROMA|nr:phospholipase A1 2 [Drosophila mauritiana]